MTALRNAIDRASANSPFLSGLMERNADLMALIEAGDLDAALHSALARQSESVGATLRQQRQGVALVTALADLAGIWDLTRVTRILSDFADHALDEAIAAAIEERVPGAPNQGFAVIALGKHGGRELNYSSDIDPIFLFDPRTLPHRERDDVAEAAVRYGRRVIELLSALDADGYVFRVDMRLRPSPEVSPIVLPVEAAISYYESSALAWEQAAFIRSRVCAGDRALGDYFLSAIQPFIWRKSLDFGQLKNITAMTAQIRDHYAKGQKIGLGYDLKRGHGGIRECEFFAQAHQLIHGGRDVALRNPDTREALAALAAAGWIKAEEAEALDAAYEQLRTVEHRLQMHSDRQTHSIPDNPETADAVARLHGLADADALIALIRPIATSVAAIYDRMVDASGSDGPRMAEDGLPLEEQLSDLGYADPAAVMQRMARWRSGNIRAIRSPSARDAFEAVLPALLKALATAPDSDRAIARFDNMIEAMPSAINVFRLLEARPGLLQLVADILSYAPTLADDLGRQSRYLDALIDTSAMDLPGDVPDLLAAMQRRIGAADYQSTLDIVRDYVGEKRFALGVQLIEGRNDALEIARSYAHLAEAALQTLTTATVAEFEKAHGKVPDSELVILALGRLGGEALTHASDLDLILLFTGDHLAESDGPRPLGATQYYNRLAQRVIASLSVPTASGALYEVDTRLRPSGADGLLCATVKSFAQYQRENAWDWEHMALTRARVLFGSDAARAEVGAIIDGVLRTSRDNAKILGDIAGMRRDMAAHKPPKGDLDVKLQPGGLVDMEFIIHIVQLTRHEGLVPQLGPAIRMLVTGGHLPPEFADAYGLLGRLLVMVRLIAPDCNTPPPAAQMLIAKSLGYADWDALTSAIRDYRGIVIAEWERLFGPRDF
ncbi:bifunctional [glutamine synthetase] adenylyltransferase/[glutamine synthetase]-adenylyl-L-tyrosine phosphorylase [Sphingorhabdus contaminans]|uniref:Bifunctional [glutamine synthetase] adenylyltransferase/[glutamine synthetase]-adenylyl-L-tyrosine phosphorylase n=1 Tax=Sphingorhabdus contaminans TaxID=1343899 RepID=A0A553WAL5_9SPHN|nr:bifunctional [glutamine synthetase] adenylyltransferase/[glutamine synthetase]-adenylyl-L-tyrosine phosphorylase [Sphingorhabdus contaminans]TSB01738.1 bifunctional [glutamine synthetase] adenylyltransferase/[glutamine synthetase]-adenylyl-L-tyrosine phosphorylase [Sphingorhabdus contaminans]